MSSNFEKTLNLITNLLEKIDERDKTIRHCRLEMDAYVRQIAEMKVATENNLAKLEEYYKKEIRKLEKHIADLSPFEFPEADENNDGECLQCGG